MSTRQFFYIFYNPSPSMNNNDTAEDTEATKQTRRTRVCSPEMLGSALRDPRDDMDKQKR